MKMGDICVVSFFTLNAKTIPLNVTLLNKKRKKQKKMWNEKLF